MPHMRMFSEKLDKHGYVNDSITKLPESSVLCGNIIEFWMMEDHLSPQGEGDLPTPQMK